MNGEFIGYFTDRSFNVLGVVSTQLPNCTKIYDDSEIDEIETGVSTYSATVEYNTESKNFVKVGNHFLFQDEDGKSKWYTIIETEKNRKDNSIYFYAEDAGLDLLNEVMPPWDAPTSKQPISYYVKKAIKSSGFEIGLNEVEYLSRALDWEGESTATKRLLSICTQFDNSEVSFGFEVKEFAVVRKFVNIHKKRGNETNITLNLDKDVSNIITSESIVDLATALRVTGGTKEGEEDPITLAGYNFDNGDAYVDGIYLKSRKALQTWTRFVGDRNNQDGHIKGSYNYDTTSQSELCSRALSHLEKISKVEVNYEVDIAILPQGVRIGDTVNVVDNEDRLYLNGRILKFERSRSQRTAIAVLGDYKIIESGISAKLQELADKIATIKPGDTFYPWVRYADDDKGNGLAAMPLGKKYMAVKYVKNKPEPSDNPSDYMGLWTKIQGEDGKDGLPGGTGEDGKTYYTWVRYADTVNGSGMSDDPKNKMYLGLGVNKTTSVPSANPNDYVWSAMYDEAKLIEMQKQVDNITYPIVSPTEPEKPKTNQQWWKTDATDPEKVIGYFVYNGIEWLPQSIQQSVLNIKDLNAVNISGSTVKGTKITGSELTNTFEIVDQGYTLVGESKMANGNIIISYAVKETGQYGEIKLVPQGLIQSVYDAKGNLQRGFSAAEMGINYSDNAAGTSHTLSKEGLLTRTKDGMTQIAGNYWYVSGANNLWVCVPNALNVRNADNTGFKDVNALAFRQQSAYSLKENFARVVTPEHALKEVNKTDVVNWNFKDHEDTQTGIVINDDGNSPFYCPDDFVNNDNSRDDTSMLGYLILSVQALSNQNSELSRRVECLETKLGKL